MSQTLLLVEDEEDLRIVLQYSLQKEGYTVFVSSTGAEGLRMVRQHKPDLLILDLNLPDMSGIDICSQIRQDPVHKRQAILMLTAKSQEEDRVRGFEAGADDYVSKPFSTRELILRVQALLRRSVEPKKEEYQFADIKLNLTSHQCFIEEKEILLTALEFRLLKKFLENEQIVLTREVLLQDVWNMDPKVNTRTVDKHVQRLRNKIGTAGGYIHTIRGVGYRLQKPEA
jgi:two-component system phosphate regulon response regulator PhoB